MESEIFSKSCCVKSGDASMVIEFLVVSTLEADIEYIVSKRVIVRFDVTIGVVSPNRLEDTDEYNPRILEFEHCPNFAVLLIFEYPYTSVPS